MKLMASHLHDAGRKKEGVNMSGRVIGSTILGVIIVGAFASGSSAAVSICPSWLDHLKKEMMQGEHTLTQSASTVKTVGQSALERAAALTTEAEALCQKGDAAGATTKAVEAWNLLHKTN